MSHRPRECQEHFPGDWNYERREIATPGFEPIERYTMVRRCVVCDVILASEETEVHA